MYIYIYIYIYMVGVIDRVLEGCQIEQEHDGTAHGEQHHNHFVQWLVVSFETNGDHIHAGFAPCWLQHHDGIGCESRHSVGRGIPTAALIFLG